MARVRGSRWSKWMRWSGLGVSWLVLTWPVKVLAATAAACGSVPDCVPRICDNDLGWVFMLGGYPQGRRGWALMITGALVAGWVWWRSAPQSGGHRLAATAFGASLAGSALLLLQLWFPLGGALF
jgi:hypothetical protein